MGTSRDIAIELVAVVSFLLESLLSSEIRLNYAKGSFSFIYALSFLVVLCLKYCAFMNGYCRLDFFIDFLSHAAIVGFMAGASITIALQQLKGLFGIKDFTTKTDIVSVMHSVWNDEQAHK
ncbi:hypothetical protein AHAS_Ahas16G0163100 [Arachis hypogaea]